jgi:hypothetical protein
MPPQPSKQARKLPRQQAGGRPVLLSSKVANVVLGCCEAVMNFKIFVKQGDATSIRPPLEADVKYVDGTLVAIIPISSTPADASGANTSSVAMFRVTGYWTSGSNTYSDYVVARTWDGTTLGTTDIKIARPPNLRPSITSETIDGVAITYTWSNGNQRSATDGTNTETQKVFPRYTTGTAPFDIIFAASVAKTGVAAVDAQSTPWQEISPARTWQV